MSETRKEAEAENLLLRRRMGILSPIHRLQRLVLFDGHVIQRGEELETKADEVFADERTTDEAMKNMLEQAEMMAEEEEKRRTKVNASLAATPTRNRRKRSRRRKTTRRESTKQKKRQKS